MQAPRPDLEAVLSALTPRERQIVGYVAAGRPNKVIAIDLGISLRTAEAHRARIFVKLDVRNAMQLACRLCAHGRSGASPILGEIEGAQRLVAYAPPTPERLALDPMAGDLAGQRVLHECPLPEYFPAGKP